MNNFSLSVRPYNWWHFNFLSFYLALACRDSISQAVSCVPVMITHRASIFLWDCIISIESTKYFSLFCI